MFKKYRHVLISTGTAATISIKNNKLLHHFIKSSNNYHKYVLLVLLITIFLTKMQKNTLTKISVVSINNDDNGS